MKHLIFIDDREGINKLQMTELNKLLCELELDKEISVSYKTVFLELSEFEENSINTDTSDTYLSEMVCQIIQQIEDCFKAGSDKIELVIDLCLDDKNPLTGVSLANALIHHNALEPFYKNNTLLITLASMYISADFDKLSENLLTKEDTNKILYCHRPIINDKFDENRYAFPEYYMRFKDKLSDESIKTLLSKATYYGNFFGMIISRLICVED